MEWQRFRKKEVLGSILAAVIFLLVTVRFGPLHLSISHANPLSKSKILFPQYQKPPQAPPTFIHSSDSVLNDVRELIALSKATDDEIVLKVKLEDATFESVVLPKARIDNKLASTIVTFYDDVSTDQALRNASSLAEKEMGDYIIEAGMREDVFHLVDAVWRKNAKLDPESQRLLEMSHKNFIHNGLAVPAGPQRDRVKEINKRLREIILQFRKTLNEENGGLWFSPEDLDGVPKDLVSNLREGEGENAGKSWLTFEYPDLFPTLQYAKKSTTRRKLFIQDENKCNSNVPLFKEVIVLRDELARILGYKNYAEFQIEDRMAESPEAVSFFLGDLGSRFDSRGMEEKKNLSSLKKQDLENRGEDFNGKYYLWDDLFYRRLMLEQKFSLNHEKIAEYFPLDSTIIGMLGIIGRLFGLVFVEIVGEHRATVSETGNGDDIVWHKDVQIFSVWNDENGGNGFVGYLYLDLFPREGKYGQDAHINLQPGYIQDDGTRHYPVAALLCNLSKPTPKKPSLLKHDELVTLFHELGHGIHDLASDTTYSYFHGTNTALDFLEVPSQMLENWAWTPWVLKSLSKHYSYLSPEYQAAYEKDSNNRPSKIMPDDLIDNIVKTKHVNIALSSQRQLHIATFDMIIHGPKTHEEIEKMDVTKTYNQLRDAIYKIDGPEEGASLKGYATYDHLVGHYRAGYYSYPYALVYSTDMFSMFKENPMDGELGRRYRHEVLESGGSKEPILLIEEFLGRKPSTEAFYIELALQP